MWVDWPEIVPNDKVGYVTNQQPKHLSAIEQFYASDEYIVLQTT